MKLQIILIFIILPLIAKGQNLNLIGNAQINNMIDKRNLAEGVELHFSTKFSFGCQIPLFYDSVKQIESVTLELSVGALYNSVYYKYSLRDKPKRDLNINTLSGHFIKVNPSFKLWQNKQKKLDLEVGVNNLFFLFPYFAESFYTNKDSSDLVLRTDYTSQFQYFVELYLGTNYRIKDLLFGMKFGYITNNLTIAKMYFVDNNEVSSVKFNNFSLLCSIAVKLPSKK